jgi:hypothetical protein
LSLDGVLLFFCSELLVCRELRLSVVRFLNRTLLLKLIVSSTS